MQRHSATYFFRTAALLLGCCFVMTACENDQQEVDNLFTKKIMLEEATQIESYLSEKGIVKAKLTAPFMLRRPALSGSSQFDSAYIEFPKTLHVDFYDTTGRIESILDARYAKHFEYEHKILLRDSVVVINAVNGDTLRTSELWWDQNKQMFYNTVPTRIYQRTQTMFAREGMRAAQNLSWKEFNKASGVIQTTDSTIMQ